MAINRTLFELRRGDVVSARFDPIEGSKQGGTRPALVLSPDRSNLRSPVVILAPMTTRNLDKIYPHEIRIGAGDGPPLDSKVLTGQLRSMSKSRVVSYYGHVSEATMRDVDDALKIAVGLDKI